MFKYIVYLRFKDKDGEVQERHYHHANKVQAELDVKQIREVCEKNELEIYHLNIFEGID